LTHVVAFLMPVLIIYKTYVPYLMPSSIFHNLFFLFAWCILVCFLHIHALIVITIATCCVLMTSDWCQMESVRLTVCQVSAPLTASSEISRCMTSELQPMTSVMTRYFLSYITCNIQQHTSVICYQLSVISAGKMFVLYSGRSKVRQNH